MAVQSGRGSRRAALVAVARCELQPAQHDHDDERADGGDQEKVATNQCASLAPGLARRVQNMPEHMAAGLSDVKRVKMTRP